MDWVIHGHNLAHHIFGIAQEDYAFVISGREEGGIEAECFDCFQI